MSAFDPMDGLLALGVITREQLNESKKVDPDLATTTAGRLVAVGVDAKELLAALSSLTGVRLATRAQLDAATPVTDMAPDLARALRDLPAAPFGRGVDGVLDVAVADPQSIPRLSALGLQRHRPWLALELDVRDAAERAFPDLDLEEADADPVDSIPADEPADEPAVVDDDAPAPFSTVSMTPFVPPPLPPPHEPLILDMGGGGDAFAGLAERSHTPPPPKEPMMQVPNEAPQPTSAITVLRASQMPPQQPQPPAEEAAPEPMERARPVREKYAPGAKPQNDPRMHDSGPTVRPTSTPGTKAPALNDARTTSTPGTKAPALTNESRPPTSSSLPMPPQKKGKGGVVVAAVLVVAAAVGGVFLGPTLREKFAGAPSTPVDENAAKQEREIAAARAEASAGSPTMSMIHCEAVIAAGAGTQLGKEARLLHAEQAYANDEKLKGLDELRQLAASLGPTDPIKAAAEAKLAKLSQALPTAVESSDAGVSDAANANKVTTPPSGKNPKGKTKSTPAAPRDGSPDVDLDHDAASAKKPR